MRASLGFWRMLGGRMGWVKGAAKSACDICFMSWSWVMMGNEVYGATALVKTIWSSQNRRK